jgi:uncharacterized protein (DUF1697 family)
MEVVTTYVALLRGINVGRNNQIPMADLREMFEGLGHTSVATLLRSGNVVFAGADQDTRSVAATIERAVTERFGMRIGVVLRSRDELARVVRDDPLAAEVTDPTRYLVTFLSAPLDPAVFADLDPAGFAPDRLAFGPSEIYQWLPAGVRDSRLAKAVPGRRLGDVVATARNWSTVGKLLAMTA